MNNLIEKKHIVNLFFVLIFFTLDRITKYLVISYSYDSGLTDIVLTSFLNLNLVWNEGIAFGLLSFNESFGYNIVTIIILFVIIVLVLMLNNAKNLSRLALLLILGGALGNFFDRAYYSAVPDFIDFYYKGFHWFIFNVADIFISFGIICLIYVELINKNTDND
jgi:signal peptidase II